MADISKLILPSGDEYNYKDAYAREFIQNLEPDLDSETATVTGDIVTFETESAQILPSVVVNIDPVQDLHGYDHPWPAGGGKNLYNATATPSSINGITITRNDDGTYLLKGTASALAQFALGTITLPAGEYILNGNPSGASSTTFDIRWTNDFIDRTGDGVTITTDGSVSASVFITVRSGYAFPTGGLVFSPMIRLATEIDPTFAPYSNICPISGWTGCEMERVGKNLTGYESGAIELNGTHTENTKRLRTPDYIKVDEGQTYAFNWSTTSGTDTQAFVYYYQDSQHSDALNTASWKSVPFTFTVPVGAKFVTITARRQSNAVLDLSTVTSFQLEQGSTATTYVPYSGTTYSVSFPSSAGTVYGGTLDVTNGVLTVTHSIGEVNSSNTSSCLKEGSTNHTYRFTATSSYFPGKVGGYPTPSLCECNQYSTIASDYSAITSNNTDMAVAASGSTGSVLLVSDSSVADANALLTRIASNPIQLYYPLATPVIYQLTPTQVTALLGQNNLWADTGDSTVIYRTGKLALLSDVADSEERVREDLNDRIDSLTAVDVGAAKDSSIAPVEPTSTASRAYSEGEYFYLTGNLCKAIASISSGATFTENTNYIVITGGGFNDLRVKVGSLSLTSTWNGNGPYTQTATITGVTITENSKVDLQLTASQVVSLISDGVIGLLTDNTSGTVTVYAIGAAPLSALTLQCTVTEVS